MKKLYFVTAFDAYDYTRECPVRSENGRTLSQRPPRLIKSYLNY